MPGMYYSLPRLNQAKAVVLTARSETVGLDVMWTRACVWMLRMGRCDMEDPSTKNPHSSEKMKK